MQHIILSWKFLTKEKLIAIHHQSDIDFKDFMKTYNDYTNDPFSFLVNNTTLSSDNPL